MKISITGSRDIDDVDAIFDIIDSSLEYIYNLYIKPDDYEWVTKIITGDAPGVDWIVQLYCKSRSFPLKVFKANWERYDKKAGPIRNGEIAEACDYGIVIIKNNSPGSKNMIAQLTSKYKPHAVYIYND